MKNIILLIGFLTTILFSAQTEKSIVRVENLPNILMSKNINIHFVSPEPIQFIDLSTKDLIGDLPSKSIGRVKIDDNYNFDKKGSEIGIITVVGQSFIAQYKAVLTDKEYQSNIVTNIQIQPEQMQPIEFPNIGLSTYELKNLSLSIIKSKNEKSYIRKKKNLKTTMKLRNVYVVDDYIFLDIEIENKTNLPYEIDDIKFSIEDKKIYKATNNQSISLEKEFELHKHSKFKKNFRNIYVFKKVTFPNSKVLTIRLFEKQISGRVIEMKIKYSDILNADTI